VDLPTTASRRRLQEKDSAAQRAAATIEKMSTDTIVALSTPPGVAALAVIRLSGPESRAMIERLVAGKVDGEPGRAVYRTLAHENKTLDDVVLTFWRAPHSYTG
jgi:tRNA modification GTPase